MARHGSVEGKALRVGRRSYLTVVVPPFTENLNGPTATLLERFLEGGGTVLSAGAAPERIDGAAADRAGALASSPGGRGDRRRPGVGAHRPTGQRIQDHPHSGGPGESLPPSPPCRRRPVLLLVNTSVDARSSGTVDVAAGGVERLGPGDRGIGGYAFERVEAGLRLHFDLPEAGSLLLRLTKAVRQPAAVPARRFAVIGADGPTAARRVGPNVLVLDYLDVRAGGEAAEDVLLPGLAVRLPEERRRTQPLGQRRAVPGRVDPPDLPRLERGRGHLPVHHQGPRAAGAVGRRRTGGPVRRDMQRTPGVAGEGAVVAGPGIREDRPFGSGARGRERADLAASPFTMQHELEPVYLLGGFTLDAARRAS